MNGGDVNSGLEVNGSDVYSGSTSAALKPADRRLSSRFSYWFAFAVGSLCGLLHVVRAGHNSISIREARYVSGLDGPWLSLAERKVRIDATDLGSDVLMRFWLSISRTAFFLRVLPFASWFGAFILLLALVELVGRQFVAGPRSDKASGASVLLAAGLFLGNGMLQTSAETIHPAAFQMLALLVAAWHLIRCLKNPTVPQMLVSSVVLALGTLVHPPLVALVPGFFLAQAASLWFGGGSKGQWRTLLVVCPACVAFVGQMLLVFRQLRYIDPNSSGRAVTSLSNISRSIVGLSGWLALSYLIIACALIVVVYLVGRQHRSQQNRVGESREKGQLLAIVVLSFGSIGSLIAMLFVGRIFPSVWSVTLRTDNWAALPFAPLFALGSGVALMMLRESDQKEATSLGVESHRSGATTTNKSIVRVGASLAMALALVGGLQKWVRNDHHEPWRPLVDAVFTKAEQGDTILFATDGARHPFEFSRSRTGPAMSGQPTPLFPIDPWGGFTRDRERKLTFPKPVVEAAMQTRRRVWVVTEKNVVLDAPGLRFLEPFAPLFTLSTDAGTVRLYEGRLRELSGG